MKRLAVILALLFVLPACGSGDEEETLRELTQKQIGVVRVELNGIERSQSNLETQLSLLQSSLFEMDNELKRVDARLFAAESSNNFLFELQTVGFGQTPGHWVLENPAWPTNVLMLFALAVVLCWVLYRMRLRTGEAAAQAEVDRVMARLSVSPAPPAPPAAPATKAPIPAAPSAPASSTRTANPPALSFKVPAPAAPPARASQVQSVPVSAPPAAKPKPAGETAAAKKPSPAAKPAAADKPAAGPLTAPPVPANPAADKTAAKRTVARREARRKTNRPQAKKCKVEGCPNKHRSKGFCNKHYQQWRRSENPEGDQEE